LDTQIHFHVPGSIIEIVKKLFVEYIDCRTYVWVCDTNISGIKEIFRNETSIPLAFKLGIFFCKSVSLDYKKRKNFGAFP